jgi:hypothetical protein
MYPYVTAGCTFGENDFDFDSNSGNVGSVTFTSRSGFFTQSLTSATLSSDNSWNRDTITGWNSDGSATEYGVWSSNLTVNSYLVSGTPNGNYGSVYLSNYQSAANPPAANPTANAFRIYLPTDASTAPAKPYLRHTFVNPLGPNPPPIGVPIPFSVIVAFVNPTPYAITFDATHLVTANVPGGGSVFGGNAQVSLGSLVSQPAVGGTGNLTWNPGVVAAGSTALLSYTVITTFSSNGQRIPLSATPASGNGTRAFFVDETGNTAQTRASYTFGPMCELAATAGLATAAPATISGIITTSAGEPLGGVSVKLGGDKIDRTITDSSGGYRFTDVDTDGFYSVTPTLTNFTFAPPERSFSLLGDRTDAVFTAVPTTQLGNPLDEEGFFVRQQYLDFLNREPDHSGFLYWSDEIANCGGDAACIRARRIAVSASFFASEEFQQTGSFVYRLYRAGLARPVTFAEFLSSGPSIMVGPGGDTSRDKFARDFCARADFIARFSAATTPEAFVDALIASIKNDSGADLINQRDALLTAYNAVSNDVGLSRSRVLRLAIEQPAFTQAEFNRAFVLMQYFGYLRRDPDQGGFDFWLDVLNNRERDNYLAMVCAFVTSTEYQQRFASFISRGNSECGQ